MSKRNWYKLDNVGKFYSFTNKKLIPAVFRYSVSLNKNVDKNVLQEALNECLKLFPNFKCHLKKGFFWYYLENGNDEIKVLEENIKICSRIYNDEHDFLIRVSYYKKRINFEISHILSDGRGSLNFFKCLVYKYLILKEKLNNIDIDLDSSFNEKIEDSFDKHYTKVKLTLPKRRKIYQYKGLKKDDISYFEYHLSVNKVLELAHKYDASLTSLLIAVMIISFHENRKEREYNKVIKIDVPVDLRKYYKSNTSRNFFGLTSIIYKFDRREYEFEDIIKSVNEQLKENTSIENLKERMNQMIYLEKNVVTRFAPIFIKDLVLKIADMIFMGTCTSCISNIGSITVDSNLEKYIENFNVLTASGSLKITLCSFKDDLSIGISSKYINNNIIKSFCRFFSNNNISGVMNTSEDVRDEKM